MYEHRFYFFSLPLLSASMVIQDSSTISFTFRLYSLLSSENSFAASELAGEFGLGSQRRDCIEVNMADTS